jgi:enterochelin esterase-like enzyme
MANMSVRMRRIASDWEQIQRDFTGHKNIVITPVGTEPPEKYHVTYFVNGYSARNAYNDILPRKIQDF